MATEGTQSGERRSKAHSRAIGDGLNATIPHSRIAERDQHPLRASKYLTHKLVRRLPIFSNDSGLHERVQENSLLQINEAEPANLQHGQRKAFPTIPAMAIPLPEQHTHYNPAIPHYRSSSIHREATPNQKSHRSRLGTSGFLLFCSLSFPVLLSHLFHWRRR